MIFIQNEEEFLKMKLFPVNNESVKINGNQGKNLV